MLTTLIVVSSVLFVSTIVCFCLWRNLVEEQKRLEFHRSEDNIYRSMDQSFMEVNRKIDNIESDIYAEITRSADSADRRLSDVERRLDEWEE